MRHAAGRRVTAVTCASAHLRQVVPDSLAFYFGIVARETVCEGARLEQELVAARGCAARLRRTSGRSTCPTSAARAAARAGRRGASAASELEVESIEVEEEAACTA